MVDRLDEEIPAAPTAALPGGGRATWTQVAIIAKLVDGERSSRARLAMCSARGDEIAQIVSFNPSRFGLDDQWRFRRGM